MAQIELGAVDDGRSIVVELGDELVVVLEENPTTGYRWTVTGVGGVVGMVDDGYARTLSEPLPAEPVFGRGGAREFRLAALSTGVATLRFVLRHEWEEDEDDTGAIARYSVTVEVVERRT